MGAVRLPEPAAGGMICGADSASGANVDPLWEYAGAGLV